MSNFHTYLFFPVFSLFSLYRSPLVTFEAATHGQELYGNKVSSLFQSEFLGLVGKGLTAMQEVPGSNPTEGKKIFFSFSELEKSSFSSQSLYLDLPFSFLHVLRAL